MKKNLVFMVATLLATSLSAQDLIVTSFGDTIPCKITKMDSISVTYQIIKKDGARETGILARQFVSDFRIEQKNVSSPIDIENTEAKTIVTDSTATMVFRPEITRLVEVTGTKQEFATIRLGFAPGYAKRLSKMAGKGAYTDLYDKLTNGFSWGADLQVYINKGNGIGLNVSGVHSSASVNDRIVIPKFGNCIDLKVKQRMFYIGPAWTKLYATNHFLFTGNLSLGALFFTEKHDRYGTGTFEDNHSVAGGINSGAGIETKISSVCAIGLKTGVTLDSVSLFNIGDQSFKPIIPVSWSSFYIAAYISFRN